MHNKVKLYGLAISCSFEDECDNCPMKEIRKLKDFEQKVETIDKMTLEEIAKLTQFHNNHRHEREEKIRNFKK
jgi:hypothetical protein